MNLAVGARGGGHGRQGGSAFKPLVLAATLEDGYSVESSFDGPPQIVIPKADNGKDWTVEAFKASRSIRRTRTACCSGFWAPTTSRSS